MGNAPALQYLLVPVLTTHRRLYTTGSTNGFASLTLRVVRDGEPGGFNMNNDGCNPSEAKLRTIYQAFPSEAILREMHQPSSRKQYCIQSISHNTLSKANSG